MPTDPLLHVVPILCVTDLTRAIDFYRLLGFAAERYRGGDGYAFLDRRGWQLHLAQSDVPLTHEHPGNGVYFYLAPNTAAALEAEFRAAGAPIRSPLSPREWRMNEFVVVDPDENLLRFGEYLHEPAARTS